MRDKIYIYVTAGIFLLLLIVCPATFLFEKAGLVQVEDLANYKVPEKVYYYDVLEAKVKTRAYVENSEENIELLVRAGLPARVYMNTLNAIEEGKATVDTVYTNYLPFYAELLRFLSSADGNVQDEFVMMLYNWENRQTMSIDNAEQTQATTETNIAGDDAPGVPPDNINSGGEIETTTEPVTTEPPPPQLSFISSKIDDAGMFRVYRVRTPDNSFGFLDISMAMGHSIAAQNMRTELAHVNRIAAANKDVNFFVYIPTRMQDTAYYNDIIKGEPSTHDLFTEFINGLSGDIAGVAWLDIDTPEKRMDLLFLTDHHWNAKGAYQGYTEIISMINKVVPEIGEPLPLKGLIEFPDVESRGSGAARTNTPVYYDNFAVMDIDLPRQDSKERVTSDLNNYLNGEYDIKKLGKNNYKTHYEDFYSQPTVITYPDNNTGRRLLILGDSYVYWVSWLIGANFDKTFVHYTLWQNDLNYNKFIADNGVTDVLLLQYSARTLSKATSAAKYLEQVITR